MSNKTPESVLVYPVSKDAPVKYDSVTYDEVDRNGSLHLAHADNTRGEIVYAVWAAGSWSHLHVIDGEAAAATTPAT